jgi:N6-adenosine-specific RNA methylase IME4
MSPSWILRTEVRPISSIKIGYRHRKELGDIPGLWEDVKDGKLLHPPRILEDGTLISGLRRIEAFKYGGQTEMPFTVGEVEDHLQAEFMENNSRLDFSPRELFNITRALKQRWQKESRERQGTRTDIGENLPEVVPVRDRLASIGNMSGPSFSKLEQVFEAAAAHPEIFGDIADELERTNNIDKAFVQLRHRQKRNGSKNLPVLPPGKFSVIIVDAAWDMKRIDTIVALSPKELDYDTMSNEEIRNFFQNYVVPIAADDCHLFVWVPQTYLPFALSMLTELGFTYGYLHTWHKTTGFQPFNRPKYNSEFVIYAYKGSPKFVDTTAFSTCFPNFTKETEIDDEEALAIENTSRQHSRKPDLFYDTIRRVTDGRRIDMFSRESREGFDQFGDQVRAFVETIRTKVPIDLVLDELDV